MSESAGRRIKKSLLIKTTSIRFLGADEITDLKNCDLVFISQDVPTNFQGKSNLLEIKKLIKKIIRIIKKTSNLIILCQQYL